MDAQYMAKKPRETEFSCKSRLLTIITWVSIYGIYEDHDTDIIKVWISIHGAGQYPYI